MAADRIAAPRKRTSTTARKSGTAFERTVADALAARWQSSIDRKVKVGSADEGDLAGMTVGGFPVVVECKNVRAMNLGMWWREAQKEADNLLSALAKKGRAPRMVHAVFVHKRHGMADGADQWVTMPVWQLLALLEDAGGQR